MFLFFFFPPQKENFLLNCLFWNKLYNFKSVFNSKKLDFVCQMQAYLASKGGNIQGMHNIHALNRMYFNSFVLFCTQFYKYIIVIYNLHFLENLKCNWSIISRGLSRGKIKSVFGHFTKFSIRKTDTSQNSVWEKRTLHEIQF